MGVRAEIEKVSAQLAKDAAERDKLATELRRAEVLVNQSRMTLAELRRQRDAVSQRRTTLLAERRRQEQTLAAERAALAGQLRAAYMIGREEPLKLLLNQKDPARVGRMFAYYGYFGRARGEQIGRIQQGVARIIELDDTLVAEDEKLAGIEQQQRDGLSKLEHARTERSGVLAQLKDESRSRTATLSRLRQQQVALEKLLRELRRAAERFPVDSTAAFARMRGSLPWPVEGRVLARYGEARAGAVRWDGVLLGTERGAEVHAVYHGRVLYADWLAGLGLLVILDHGDGYMSLYAHNDVIFRKAGERVIAGDVIAGAGDSGGRSRPELYFEIRRGSRPLDPRPWLKGAR